MLGEKLGSQILVNVLATDVLRCTRLNHLQSTEMETGNGPPDWTPIVRYKTHELLVKQDTVPYRLSTLPVKDRPQHFQPLGSFLPNLVDMRRPGQPCV